MPVLVADMGKDIAGASPTGDIRNATHEVPEAIGNRKGSRGARELNMKIIGVILSLLTVL